MFHDAWRKRLVLCNFCNSIHQALTSEVTAAFELMLKNPHVFPF